MSVRDSQKERDSRKLEYLLQTAGDKNPFASIINRFHRRPMNEETLDELALVIEESLSLKELKLTLDETKPDFTSLFRYDATSIKLLGFDGCFSSRQSMGASVAYGRVFEGLTSDKIFSLRAPDELMVVVDHPSRVIGAYDKPYDTDEPTVLFTSRMFQYDAWMNGRDTHEDHQVGMVITHGNSPLQVMPDTGLLGSRASDGYIAYAIEHAKRSNV